MNTQNLAFGFGFAFSESENKFRYCDNLPSENLIVKTHKDM